MIRAPEQAEPGDAAGTVFAHLVAELTGVRVKHRMPPGHGCATPTQRIVTWPPKRAAKLRRSSANLKLPRTQSDG